MKRASYWLWPLTLFTMCLAGCGTSGASATSQSGGAAAAPSVDPTPAGDKAASDPTASAQPAQIGDPVAMSDDVRLSIVDYDGILQLIARQRGKVVVMDAWSTSCPPCMKEFHNLVELHKRYGPEQVACISLSFDYEGLGPPEEQQDRVLKFLRKQGATFDNLLSSEESDTLYRKFRLAAVPAVFVYDRAGQLRKRFDNEQSKNAETAFTYEQVGQLVAELLQENPAAERAGPDSKP
jgi:thiol-disulfide isomerase/thioredoxin